MAIPYLVSIAVTASDRKRHIKSVVVEAENPTSAKATIVLEALEKGLSVDLAGVEPLIGYVKASAPKEISNGKSII